MPSGTPRVSVMTERLTPSLPRSVGFFPVFFPAERRLGHGSVQCLPPPPDASLGVIRSQASSPEAMKDTSLAPFLEVPMHGTGRAELRRQRLPLAACAQQIEDSIGDAAKIYTRATALPTTPIPGQKRFQLSPHFLRHLRKPTAPIAIHIHLRAKNRENPFLPFLRME
jgi:hypothetical protein